MKKTGRRLLYLLLFVVGLGIFLYPTISDQWNKYRAGKLISKYDGVVADSATEEIDYADELKKANEYNQKLVGAIIPDIFSIYDGVEDEEYESILNVNQDGMMGYIEIPVIDVNLPIFHYTIPDILENGAGHILGSSLPVGGVSTHAVISAHRGLPSAKMFTDLDRLEEGNQFYIHVLGDILAYEVDQVLVVKPDEVDSLGITKGEDYVTLVTCTPYAINSDRLLVRGHRVPFEEERYEQEQDETAMPHTGSVLIRILCVLVGILIAVLIVYVLPKLAKKKNRK